MRDIVSHVELIVLLAFAWQLCCVWFSWAWGNDKHDDEVLSWSPEHVFSAFCSFRAKQWWTCWVVKNQQWNSLMIWSSLFAHILYIGVYEFVFSQPHTWDKHGWTESASTKCYKIINELANTIVLIYNTSKMKIVKTTRSHQDFCRQCRLTDVRF